MLRHDHHHTLKRATHCVYTTVYTNVYVRQLILCWFRGHGDCSRYQHETATYDPTRMAACRTANVPFRRLKMASLC